MARNIFRYCGSAVLLNGNWEGKLFAFPLGKECCSSLA